MKALRSRAHLRHLVVLMVLLLAAPVTVFGQETLKGESEKFRLVIPKPVVDEPPPAPIVPAPVRTVAVTQPAVEPGGATEAPGREVMVRGHVSDRGNVVRLAVQGVAAQLSDDGGFEASVTVPYGETRVRVAAEWSDGASKETHFVLSRRDVTPPEIVIYEPAVRGLRVVTKEGQPLRVRGRATDEAGIAHVTVNGVRAQPAEGGNFDITIRLASGQSEVTVVAVDASGLSASASFTVEQEAPVRVTGKYYALVVGIDQYMGSWYPLENAVRDAGAVARLLSEEYRFDEVIALYDEEATREKIIGQMERLAEQIGPEDNVLIYYSGHGEFNERFNRGYWVPQDATTRSTAHYISNTDLRTYINGIRSRHTLLITDACFAGDVFRSGAAEMIEFENSDEYYEKVYRRLSRKAITSGGVEPVMDGGRDGHSVFTYYLLKALTNNQSRYFDSYQLYNELRIPVINNSQQSPEFRPIRDTGDEGGQFLFIRR